MAESPRVGFIGLGLMGEGMATNILKAGYPLTVTANRNRAPIDRLCSAGAIEVSSPAQVAAASDVLILCVGTAQQVEAILTGPGGVIESAHEKLVVVDCTTSLPETTLSMAKALAAKGAGMLDAPLARTPKEAWEGRLNILCGGDAATLARVRPVLESFSENIFHIGALADGHKLKLINNFLSIGAAALTVEAATAAKAMGVDLNKLFEVCSAGGANSAMFQAVMPWILEADDTRMQFSIANARKDIGYLLTVTRDSNTPTRLLPTLDETLEKANKQGFGDAYIPKLYDAWGKLSG